jgi:hypothetical protein
MNSLNMLELRKIFLGAMLITASGSVFSQYARQECQAEINRMREIYIIILRKIPAMPPLAQLSPGIQRALNDAEMSRDNSDYRNCIVNMQRQISIVQGYAK